MSEQKLTIVARIMANEGKSELVKAELIKLIAPTKAEEGCIDYDLHQDNENPNLFLFFENWLNRELWQKHMGSAHLAEFSKTTEGAVAEVIVHEMTQVG